MQPGQISICLLREFLPLNRSVRRSSGHKVVPGAGDRVPAGEESFGMWGGGVECTTWRKNGKPSLRFC